MTEPRRSALESEAERRGFALRALPPDAPVAAELRPALCIVELHDDAGARRVASAREALGGAPLVVLAGRLSVEATLEIQRAGVADLIGLSEAAEGIASRCLATLGAAAPPAVPDAPTGGSARVRALRRRIRSVAPTDATVLLTGETGTGKGLVARTIHRHSRRRSRCFVHVDCAALSASVIESELFGHERGAFTGAVGRRLGRFEQAGDGTIFLDEIGELGPELQAKLLRVLQDREYERLGGVRTLPMRARVLAATSRDLGAALRGGTFRPDLYYRLAVVELRIPPLRERLEDLPELVRSGVGHLSRRLGRSAPEIEPGFYERLRGCAWPGNVRELLNLLERLLVEHPTGWLHAGLLNAQPAEPPAPPEPAGSPAQPDAARPPTPAGAAAGRERIVAVLIETGGNVARAARRLGLPRSTLRHRIARHGLGHLIPRD